MRVVHRMVYIERLLEWLEDLRTIVVGQSALAFRETRLLVSEAVTSLNLLGELFATEDLLARINDFQIRQHA